LFARRLAGSEDLFGPRGRPPRTSINFVTCHDGFTLTDLVSYQRKHNQANRENNRDGPSENYSLNFGEEGPSLDPRVRERRLRQKRNLLTTLFFSLGTPMINGGDELGRTQWGNNNAWCQDNTISWYSWNLSGEDAAFLDFFRRVAALRRRHPALRRPVYYSGKPGHPDPDIRWLHPEGRDMTVEDWQDAGLRTLGARVTTEGLEETGPPLVLVFHASHQEAVEFVLPPAAPGHRWESILDTGSPEAPRRPEAGVLVLEPRTVMLLEQVPG